MYSSAASMRLSERPARGLTKLIGIASRLRTSALRGSPVRHISSARAAGVASEINASVGIALTEGSVSLTSLASMRTEYFSNSMMRYSAEPGGPI